VTPRLPLGRHGHLASKVSHVWALSSFAAIKTGLFITQTGECPDWDHPILVLFKNPPNHTTTTNPSSRNASCF
jgi:hypothetical protein